MYDAFTPLKIGLPGKRELVDLRNLQKDDIELPTIIDTLDRINRFAGRSKLKVSVARHSVFVGMILEATNHSLDIVLGGICHDFSEAFIGDIIKPVKDAFPGIKELENNVMYQIQAHLDIGFWQAREVKWADMVAVGYEAEVCQFDTTCWNLPPKDVSKFLLDMCWARSRNVRIENYILQIYEEIEDGK